LSHACFSTARFGRKDGLLPVDNFQVEHPTEREDGEPSARAPFPWRVAAYLLGGAAAVGLAAVFLPPLTFYFGFQRVILAQGEDPGARSMLWSLPDEEPPDAPAAGWTSESVEGLRLSRPPGRLIAVRREGDLRELELEDGAILVYEFPAGFIGALFRAEMQKIGGPPGASLPDPLLLGELARETPERYRFGLGGAERRRYAARLLTKMLLWEPREARRMSLCLRAAPLAAAVLVEYTSGEAKVIAADGSGTLVFLLPEGTPPAWKLSAGRWLRS
jgi:hypothetical protein